MAAALEIVLDSPGEGESVGAQVRVRGWAAVPGNAPIVVDVLVDGERLGTVASGESRPDVAAARGDGASEDCGFSGTVPMAAGVQGDVLLTVRARTATGDEASVERQITVAADEAAADEPGALGYRVLRVGDEPWPWFSEHHDDAAQQVIDFLGGDGLSLEGRQVADVGCGDGIIDLGLVHHARPGRLVGYDLEPTDVDALATEARRNGVLHGDLPGELAFEVCTEDLIPAQTHSFDAVVTWSTFEHVRNPVRVFKEIRRIMRPDGFLFLQIWPLWFSEHGSHLWPWYPSGFAPLLHSNEEIDERLREQPRGSEVDTDFMVREYKSLNRATVDDLQRSMLAAGLFPTKFEFLTSPTRVPPELARYPLTDLGIAGIKLIAVLA